MLFWGSVALSSGVAGTSGCLPAGATSASHAWAASGSYTVTALAADATDLLIQSSPSSGVTVVVTPPPPAITGLSSSSGAAGVQIAISGSGFGSAQGTGKVLLGRTFGTVVSWSNTRIVATVASNSITGLITPLLGTTFEIVAVFTLKG